MGLDVRFTVPEVGREIPFSIFTDRGQTIYLYSETEDMDYRFPLVNDGGLLRLQGNNPFEESLEVVNERLTGMASDWLETRAIGFEVGSESVVDRQPGYGPDDIFVENKPFSLKQIVDLIEDRDIELSPDFQRNFVWDRTRQSRLIESILLGLPLPSIYLSQYEDGRLTVVDGLQRLSTIHAFVHNHLRLSNLEYLTDCNDKTYGELQNVLPMLRLRRFYQTQIMCFVIDYRSPSKLKFDLFRRLNTGGKPLNNQEIRNCISRPHVQKVLKEMVMLESFALATDRSVKDTRMDAREAALRFIYFSEQYTSLAPIGTYDGDMEGTLDDFVDQLNSRTEENLRKFVPLFDRGLKNSYRLMDRFCFRKVQSNNPGQKRSQVNKLLMLVFTVILSKANHEQLLLEHEQGALIEKVVALMEEDAELFDAISWSTNSRWNIETAFRKFRPLLSMP